MKDIKKMLDIACEALEEKKADDISVIDISKISVLADYYVITGGDNVNHVHALVDNVEEKLGRAGFSPRSTEGYREAKWVLLDYGDIIINVFSKEDRRFYDLERIWKDGVFVDRKPTS
ncbi:MAG: ribosome silencing factor [Lachnospiraceae bacterium]|nr:ribosome silencing factor [Lachnospiraceae bacterium]